MAESLGHIRRFDPSNLAGYAPKVAPKARRLDPPVCVGDGLRRLSEL